MFDIGFLELSIIMVLSLLVLGPERLPKAAKSVGYWFGKARRYVEGMKEQVEAEFDTTEVKRLLHNQEVQIRELQNKLQNTDEFIDTDYHNKFENKDNPGTTFPEADESEIAEKKSIDDEKPATPQYEMIEEDDERWDEVHESNAAQQQPEEPQQAEDEQSSEKSVDAADKSQSLDKAQ